MSSYQRENSPPIFSGILQMTSQILHQGINISEIFSLLYRYPATKDVNRWALDVQSSARVSNEERKAELRLHLYELCTVLLIIFSKPCPWTGTSQRLKIETPIFSLQYPNLGCQWGSTSSPQIWVPQTIEQIHQCTSPFTEGRQIPKTEFKPRGHRQTTLTFRKPWDPINQRQDQSQSPLVETEAKTLNTDPGSWRDRRYWL